MTGLDFAIVAMVVAALVLVWRLVSELNSPNLPSQDDQESAEALSGDDESALDRAWAHLAEQQGRKPKQRGWEREG